MPAASRWRSRRPAIRYPGISSCTTVPGAASAEGISIIWIEHIVHALTAVVDQLMCLAFGKVLAIGDPHEVMRSPEVIEVYLGSTFDLGEVS